MSLSSSSSEESSPDDDVGRSESDDASPSWSFVCARLRLRGSDFFGGFFEAPLIQVGPRPAVLLPKLRRGFVNVLGFPKSFVRIPVCVTYPRQMFAACSRTSGSTPWACTRASHIAFMMSRRPSS